jgi:hypothetical protein
MLRLSRLFFAFAVCLIPFAVADVSAASTRGLTVYQAPPEGHLGLQGEVKLYNRSYAVVIGIDDYRTLPKLGGVVRDAEAVAKELEGQGFQVVTVLNGQATRQNLARLLGDQLPNRVGPDDRVLVYFAGHGVSSGQGATAMGYLMPVEGERDHIRSTGISMRELQNWFADYKSKHVMFVADACYSGLALSTRAVGLPRTLNDYLKQVTEKPVRLAFTAGGAGEVASEYRGHGLFTYYFLRGIRGEADANNDGIITSDELAAFIRPNVMQTAMAQMGRRQNPQLGRDGEGEFVFLRPRPVAAPASLAQPARQAPSPRASPAPAVARENEVIPPLQVALAERRGIGQASEEAAQLYGAARVAEAAGRAEPEAAMQAWAKLASVTSGNPFREDARKRSQDWARYVQQRDAEGAQLLRLVQMPAEAMSMQEKHDAARRYRERFGDEALRTTLQGPVSATATLAVRSTPSRAVVTVNGEEVGRTPWRGPVAGGVVTIGLRKGRSYHQQTREVLVIPGDTIRRNYRLSFTAWGLARAATTGTLLLTGGAVALLYGAWVGAESGFFDVIF